MQLRLTRHYGRATRTGATPFSTVRSRQAKQDWLDLLREEALAP